MRKHRTRQLLVATCHRHFNPLCPKQLSALLGWAQQACHAACNQAPLGRHTGHHHNWNQLCRYAEGSVAPLVCPACVRVISSMLFLQSLRSRCLSTNRVHSRAVVVCSVTVWKFLLKLGVFFGVPVSHQAPCLVTGLHLLSRLRSAAGRWGRTVRFLLELLPPQALV